MKPGCSDTVGLSRVTAPLTREHDDLLDVVEDAGLRVLLVLLEGELAAAAVVEAARWSARVDGVAGLEGVQDLAHLAALGERLVRPVQLQQRY